LSPLFQVMFVLQESVMKSIRLPGLTILPLEIDSATAKFDLTLMIEDNEDFLRGFFEYNTDLFDRGTIKRIFGHFNTLLRELVDNPKQPISELPILTEDELDQLLIDWNQTEADYARDKCLPELFQAQVEKTPEAVALVFEDQQSTYRELNQRANRLAHYLQKLGVGPEVLVAICIERSLEMVIGLYAILKAGGAYVPLDPTYPEERLAYMLQDTRAPVLLTLGSFRSILPE
ncbi:MAG: AMP-binding protein, partial [Planctomycetes bacterium]|nr:AMP-binding protein [Planctomycetota bacterium]